MKITATGWGRSVVGPHNVIETKPGTGIVIGENGAVKITGRSFGLALSGHFRFNIEFSQEDIYALATAAARAPLEQQISELRQEIRALKSA